MGWNVEFYQKENGDIPVKDFLTTLNPKMRAKAFHEIELLQLHGNCLREPYVKPIKGDKFKGIFELRVKFASDISRIFYFTYRENKFILKNYPVHWNTKKTMKEGVRCEKGRRFL